MTDLSDERLAAIRAHHTTVTDYAPAPWRWAGSVEAARPSYWLATVHHGRKYVMGARKAGFSGAELEFPEVDPKTGLAWLKQGREIAVRERPYRDQLGDIDNPFAEYLKRAPEYVGELLTEVEHQRAGLAEERDKSRAVLAELAQARQQLAAVRDELSQCVDAYGHLMDLGDQLERRRALLSDAIPAAPVPDAAPVSVAVVDERPLCAFDHDGFLELDSGQWHCGRCQVRWIVGEAGERTYFRYVATPSAVTPAPTVQADGPGAQDGGGRG